MRINKVKFHKMNGYFSIVTRTVPAWIILATFLSLPVTMMSSSQALIAQAETSKKAKASPLDEILRSDSILTNKTHLSPGPDDAVIAKQVARILIGLHYSQKPLDDSVSSRFFDNYLDALDSAHLIFLQSDISEFEKYRNTLDDLTLRFGDTNPAEIIFNRYMERYDAQVAFVRNYLKTNQFVFTNDTRYLMNRRTEPRPKDQTEAHKLWADRIGFEYLQEKLNQEKPEEIVKIITRRYTRIQRLLKEFESDDVLQTYLTALTHAYDPHSDYMGRPQMESFAIGMKLSLFGIGALLRSEDGYCRIQELTPGGPAEKSGKLKPNDRIIAVAQGDQEPVDVIDMKLSKVVDLIRGAKGTIVKMTIIPADATDPSQRKIITLVRDEIKLDERAAKARIIDPPGKDSHRIGMIDLPSFYADMPLNGKATSVKSTTTDVAKLLKKLQMENVAGIILDLRRNGGGSLEEAIRLSGLFVKKGPIVQVRDPDGRPNVEMDPDPEVHYEGPLVVLTSRHSASASEILAGALQDYGRALIVGDSSTHGKGTVQTLLQLQPYFRQMKPSSTNDPGALKVTIRKFYRPSGNSTQLKGIVPDLVLPAINNHAEIGESALPNAMEWDAIDPVPYENLNLIKPVLPELVKRSNARIAQNSDYKYVNEEIERYKKMEKVKSILMHEEKRRQEKKSDDERIKARKEELKARPESLKKVYEITLKLAEETGLPAPMSKTNTVAAATSAASIDDDDDSSKAEEDIPAIDITMDEAERILGDLIQLLAVKQEVAVSGKESEPVKQ